MYSVTATNANCATSAKINITYHTFPTLNLGNDTVFCEKKSIRINAENTENYKYDFTWSNGTKGAQITVKEENTYWVKANNKGCVTSDTIIIRAKECLEFQLYAPNIFSPNQDDNNDEWRVFPSQHFAVKQFSLKIFDRWGNQVFENQDITQSWNGATQQEGIYIYQLYLTYLNPENQKEVTFQQNGDISLIR
jgi:gliding motility-associated-like protein